MTILMSGLLQHTTNTLHSSVKHPLIWVANQIAISLRRIGYHLVCCVPQTHKKRNESKFIRKYQGRYNLDQQKGLFLFCLHERSPPVLRKSNSSNPLGDQFNPLSAPLSHQPQINPESQTIRVLIIYEKKSQFTIAALPPLI